MAKVVSHFISLASITFFIVAAITNSHAADVTIILNGKVKPNARLQVYSYKNLEEKVIQKDITIDVQNEIFLQLENYESKYYFFSVNGSGCQAYISANKANSIIFDFDKNEWAESENGNKAEPVLFKVFAQFQNYDNINVKDSASFMNYHLEFMNNLGLFPLSENREFNYDQSYARKKSFTLFSNTVIGKKLFTLTQDFNKGINKNIKDWANLENLQIKQASYYDFLAIRNFHMLFSHEIFPYNSGPLTFFEIIDFTEKWLKKMDYNTDVKKYIIGDVVQFYSKFDLKIDQQLIDKLLELHDANPSSPHGEVFKKLTIRYGNKLLNTLKFKLNANDFAGQKLELSQIKERFVFVDFWATWCTPCIKEEPFIEELRQEYKDKIAFVKISIDENYDKWLDYLLKSNNSDFSYILTQNDERENTISALNLQAIPKYFILNNERIIINSSPLRPSDPKLREVLDELLKKK